MASDLCYDDYHSEDDRIVVSMFSKDGDKFHHDNTVECAGSSPKGNEKANSPLSPAALSLTGGQTTLLNIWLEPDILFEAREGYRLGFSKDIINTKCPKLLLQNATPQDHGCSSAAAHDDNHPEATIPVVKLDTDATVLKTLLKYLITGTLNLAEQDWEPTQILSFIDVSHTYELNEILQAVSFLLKSRSEDKPGGRLTPQLSAEIILWIGSRGKQHHSISNLSVMMKEGKLPPQHHQQQHIISEIRSTCILTLAQNLGMLTKLDSFSKFCLDDLVMVLNHISQHEYLCHSASVFLKLSSEEKKKEEENECKKQEPSSNKKENIAEIKPLASVSFFRRFTSSKKHGEKKKEENKIKHKSQSFESSIISPMAMCVAIEVTDNTLFSISLELAGTQNSNSASHFQQSQMDSSFHWPTMFGVEMLGLGQDAPFASTEKAIFFHYDKEAGGGKDKQDDHQLSAKKNDEQAGYCNNDDNNHDYIMMNNNCSMNQNKQNSWNFNNGKPYSKKELIDHGVLRHQGGNDDEAALYEFSVEVQISMSPIMLKVMILKEWLERQKKKRGNKCSWQISTCFSLLEKIMEQKNTEYDSNDNATTEKNFDCELGGIPSTVFRQNVEVPILSYLSLTFKHWKENEDISLLSQGHLVDLLCRNDLQVKDETQAFDLLRQWCTSTSTSAKKSLLRTIVAQRSDLETSPLLAVICDTTKLGQKGVVVKNNQLGYVLGFEQGKKRGMSMWRSKKNEETELVRIKLEGAGSSNSSKDTSVRNAHPELEAVAMAPIDACRFYRRPPTTALRAVRWRFLPLGYLGSVDPAFVHVIKSIPEGSRLLAEAFLFQTAEKAVSLNCERKGGTDVFLDKCSKYDCNSDRSSSSSCGDEHVTKEEGEEDEETTTRNNPSFYQSQQPGNKNGVDWRTKTKQRTFSEAFYNHHQDAQDKNNHRPRKHYCQQVNQKEREWTSIIDLITK